MLKEECLDCLRSQELNCAETVLKMLGKRYRLALSKEEMKIIAAFGGGVCGDVCGALCGALGAMGKFHVHQSAHKDIGFIDSCRRFVSFFKEQMGGYTCEVYGENTRQRKTAALRQYFARWQFTRNTA